MELNGNNDWVWVVALWLMFYPDFFFVFFQIFYTEHMLFITEKISKTFSGVVVGIETIDKN